jgi:hypothetical protein
VRSSGRKKTAVTEIDSTSDPFVEAEIKERPAPLIRQIVAVAIYHVCYVDMGGTASLIYDHGKSFVFYGAQG